MELKDFITQTLVDITQGVEDANKVAKRFQLSGTIHQRGTSGEIVEFDVGLQVKGGNEKGVKGGISVANIGIGGDAKKTEGFEATHRLKFRVFVTEK